MLLDDQLTNLGHLARLDSLTTSDVPGIAVVETSEQGAFGEHTAGWARFDEPLPMTAHTIGNLFSTTTLVTATAVIQLHERGIVDPDYRFFTMHAGDHDVCPGAPELA